MRALRPAHVRNVAAEQVISNKEQRVLQLAPEAGSSGELASRRTQGLWLSPSHSRGQRAEAELQVEPLQLLQAARAIRGKWLLTKGTWKRKKTME